MNSQDKSKEELLQELKKLKQEYTSLKASYKKDIADRKITERALRESGESLRLAQNMAHIGNWELNLTTNVLTWSEEIGRIFELDPTKFAATYEAFLDKIHPDDRQIVDTAYSQSLDNREPYRVDHRLLMKDGRVKYVHERCITEFSKDGEALISRGTVQDITERKIIEDTLLVMTDRYWAQPGGDFFAKIAKYLGETLSVEYVLIDRVDQNGKRAVSLANYQKGEICPNFEYSLSDTPCEKIYGKKMCSYASHIQQDFPHDTLLSDMNVESYSGIPLWDANGNPVGLIALMSCKPLQNIPRIEALLQLVAAHTGKEIGRMDAEKKLRESEEKYRNIFESVQDVYYQTDLDGVVLDISPSIKHFTDYNRDDMLGKSVYDLYFDPDDGKLLLEALRKESELKDYEVKLKTETGAVRYGSVNATLVYDADNKPLHINGAIRDITERKRVEEALKEREFFFKESQKAAFIGSYSTNFLKGRWESSEVLDKIFGIDKEYDRSVPGWIEIVHPADREMMNRYLAEEVIAKRKPFNKEYRIVNQNDGQIKWVLGQGVVDIDENGDVLSLIGTIQDITERKLNEYEIRKLNRAVEATSEVVFVTDRDGIFTYVNPAFTAVFGHQAIDVIGKVTPRILKSGQMVALDYKYFWQQLINNRVVEGELINKTKDGRNIKVEGSSNAILNETGEIIGFISIQKDITKRKQIEEELLNAKEKAEESDRLKSAFLANMSHEIRTPMNGILGFAALLKEPNLTSDELQEYIQTIQISGERMLNTINSIVDVSRIESGLISINIGEANINERIEFIYRFFKPEADIKGLKFSIKTGLESKEATLLTDNEKVYGVLTNLVKNAIKFTYDGSIEFGYKKKGGNLEFFVRDTGIGIKQNQVDIIFERFRQGSESINRGFEGSGLGLSICKSYVEMLDGEIWVESEEGKGSTFYFTIPYNTPLEESREIADVVQIEHKDVQEKSLKILIVEDDEVSHILLTNRLKKISTDLLHATTGVEAIEACKNYPDIDLILMDIRMPEMNGHKATRQIRHFNKEVIIIAQTAFALTGDREKAIESGCNDYITKPINRSELMALIEKYFKDKIQ